jgi:hypothetical protein
MPPVTIHLFAVQHLGGRGHDHVRAFGTREGDPFYKTVEVALQERDAIELISLGKKLKEFPTIEVPSFTVILPIHTEGVKLFHFDVTPAKVT